MGAADVVGIDLGTTNSLVAVVTDRRPWVLPVDGSPLLPSVVGLDEQGRRIVGTAARNQYIAAPERTVRSIKRQMGREGYVVTLGGERYTPEAISAFILGRLVEAATAQLGAEVRRAVITVPAYFTDRQRQATMRAGDLAGLKVERLLHEPTAAALVYGLDRAGATTALVYDLGGGTFDVSVVEFGAGVTEVRASHGNRELGGDDFDVLIVEHLLAVCQQQHGVDLRPDRLAMARLTAAAERAKIHLSDHAYVEIREEFLANKDGRPVHLETELTRHQFEEMIRPLLQSTLESVRRALAESVRDARALDEVLLVGGSTRIPLVRELVAEELGREPRQEINPEEAVALGAAVQAAVVAGTDVDQVLVDVCPHSIGVRVLATRGWRESDDVFAPVIWRNTAIPVSRSEFFYTVYPEQTDVRIRVYQGEDPVASRNTFLGEVLFQGLSPAPDGGQREVLVAFDYDVNGILHVAAVDRRAGRRMEANLHTQTLAQVNVGAASPGFSEEDTALLARLKRAEDQVRGDPEAYQTLRGLLRQAEALAARPEDAAGLEQWRQAASEFVFLHATEY